MPGTRKRKISSKKFNRKLKKADNNSVKTDIYYPQTGQHGEENRPKIAMGDPGSVYNIKTTSFTKGNKKYTKVNSSHEGSKDIYNKEKIRKDLERSAVMMSNIKNPQATRPPKGTKEEKFEIKQEKRNLRVKNRLDKNLEKKLKKSSRVQSNLDDGKITEALADQKQTKIFKYDDKKEERKRFNYNR